MSYEDKRIKRLQTAMKAWGVDAFYVRDLSNITWLTAFEGVFDGEDAHALIVTFDRAVLHTDSRYAHAAQEAAQGTRVEVDATAQSHAAFLGALLGRYSKSASKEDASLCVGIETTMTLQEYRSLESMSASLAFPVRFCERDAEIITLRAVKDADEIRRLKVAQAVTDAAFLHIIDFIRPGHTEREVQIELEDYMIRHGASALAFSSIVAAGPNGASPHAIPGETVLKAGDSLVLDFGARLLGYCSDMTRTIFLGEPSAQMREAYAALREANETVEKLLKPGVTGAQAQKIAEDILAQAGFGGRMGHSLGHGVGIDVHEEPRLAAHNTKALVAGNVVTVEPGIYLPQLFGMRLEDFGVITESGFDIFTQSTHDMVII